MAHVHVRGQAGDRAGIDEELGAKVCREAAIETRQRVLTLVIDRREHVEAVGGVAAEADRRGLVIRAAAAVVLRAFLLAAGFHALEFALQDEVDDARDGVAAVDRRGAVAEDLHPLDRRHGNLAEVDADAGLVAEGVVADAPPVEQHQCRAFSEAAQRYAGEAGMPLVADAHGMIGVARVRAQSRDEFLDARDAHALDFLARDHLHRQRALHVCGRELRAGDDDMLRLGGIVRRGRLREHRRDAAQQAQQGPRRGRSPGAATSA